MQNDIHTQSTSVPHAHTGKHTLSELIPRTFLSNPRVVDLESGLKKHHFTVLATTCLPCHFIWMLATSSTNAHQQTGVCTQCEAERICTFTANFNTQ